VVFADCSSADLVPRRAASLERVQEHAFVFERAPQPFDEYVVHPAFAPVHRDADKDSDKRQLASIEAYAKAAGLEIVATFYDAAVSGVDSVTDPPGFAEMLERPMSNGARSIVVESPDRFARDLMVQLAGHDTLRAKGISLIAASAPTFFIEDTPTAVLVRQVLGAVARFEKTTTVAKLAAARRGNRQANGKCEGRKSMSEGRPGVVALAKALARKKLKGGKMSLREVSTAMASEGFINERGRPFNPKSSRSCWPHGRFDAQTNDSPGAR
jgi:DNA invertase Pin-like site-specific DNA recombinase